MTDEEFQSERYAQNVHLDDQVQALAKNPAIFRKYIDHEIRCTRCGDPVIQVVHTEPYRVVRHRDTTEAKGSIRLDNHWWFFPIARTEPDELPGGVPDVSSACRCAQHRFTLKDILERPGRKSTSRPPRPLR